MNRYIKADFIKKSIIWGHIKRGELKRLFEMLLKIYSVRIVSYKGIILAFFNIVKAFYQSSNCGLAKLYIINIKHCIFNAPKSYLPITFNIILNKKLTSLGITFIPCSFRLCTNHILFLVFFYYLMHNISFKFSKLNWYFESISLIYNRTIYVRSLRHSYVRH